MFRLENLGSESFEKFLRAQGPLRVRFAEAIAEGGEAASLWVDDLAAPQMAVNAGRGWLTPLGRPEAILARLEEMERLSAQMERSESYLKLSSTPLEIQEAVAQRRKLIRGSPVGMFVLDRRRTSDPSLVRTASKVMRSEDAKILAENSPYEEGEAYTPCREFRTGPLRRYGSGAN